jgi:hypothetical protein
MGRQRRRRSEWQQLIEALHGSGLTQPEFAAERGLNAKTLENWIHRLRREAAKQTTAVQFLPVTMRPATAVAVNDASVIEACFAGGVRLRFAAGVDCDYLGRLFAVMSNRPAC